VLSTPVGPTVYLPPPPISPIGPETSIRTPIGTTVIPSLSSVVGGLTSVLPTPNYPPSIVPVGPEPVTPTPIVVSPPDWPFPGIPTNLFPSIDIPPGWPQILPTPTPWVDTPPAVSVPTSVKPITKVTVSGGETSLPLSLGPETSQPGYGQPPVQSSKVAPTIVVPAPTYSAPNTPQGYTPPGWAPPAWTPPAIQWRA
jgi:hypothetical protein